MKNSCVFMVLNSTLIVPINFALIAYVIFNFPFKPFQ